MLTEDYLKLYKNYTSLNYLFKEDTPQRKLLWFRLYNLNKKRRFLIFN